MTKYETEKKYMRAVSIGEQLFNDSKKLALSRGLNLSQHIRDLLMKALEKGETNDQDI